MPHIRMRALSEEQVAVLSQKMPKSLAKIIETSEDNFTFELVATQFFHQGKLAKSYPLIEVLWFRRSQEIQNQAAAYITEQVKALVPNEDVTVIFQEIAASDYYENGSHF